MVAVFLSLFQVPAMSVVAAPAVSDEPSLSIVNEPRQIELSGDVSSVGHEAILRQAAVSLFPRKSREFSLRVQSALPAGWALVSELGMRLLAQTYSSTMTITPDVVVISGIVASETDWSADADRLRGNLLPSMTLNLTLDALPAALDPHCRRVFDNTIAEKRIRFARSSEVIRPASLPLIQALAQLVADCPTTTIEISYMPDDVPLSSTAENSATSLWHMRALAVRDYLVSLGIRANRVELQSVNSSDDTGANYLQFRLLQRVQKPAL